MTGADDVVQWAQLELGRPYVYGAEGPNAFDCSGLMQFVFGQIGVSLPRTAAQQQNALPSVRSPAPGDLVFYGRPATHVALYVGAGKVIDAPKPGGTVGLHDMYGAPTSYGRVAGIGTALAPVVGVAKTAASTVTGWLGGARHMVLEGLFVVLGVGLLGYGAYRTVKPQVGKAWGQVRGLL